MLEPIEEEFYNIEPEFTSQLHNSIMEGKDMDPDYKDKLITSYNYCYVGTVRQKLGLPKHYESMLYEKTHCPACVHVADQLVDDEEKKNNKDYLFHLEFFKVHIQGDHGKLL